VAATNSPAEWLTIDLGRIDDVNAVQVNFADYRSNIFSSDSTVYTRFEISSSVDGKEWRTIADLTKEKRDRPNAYIELPSTVKARYIRYNHCYAASPNLAISDIRVFGNGDNRLPDPPAGFSVRRETDRRNAIVQWKGVSGAVGYNVRWGIRRDRLYETYQVFADAATSLEIRALTTDQGYYFAVETFNERGVSALSEVVACP